MQRVCDENKNKKMTAHQFFKLKRPILSNDCG